MSLKERRCEWQRQGSSAAAAAAGGNYRFRVRSEKELQEGNAPGHNPGPGNRPAKEPKAREYKKTQPDPFIILRAFSGEEEIYIYVYVHIY